MTVPTFANINHSINNPSLKRAWDSIINSSMISNNNINYNNNIPINWFFSSWLTCDGKEGEEKDGEYECNNTSKVFHSSMWLHAGGGDGLGRGNIGNNESSKVPSLLVVVTGQLGLGSSEGGHP